MKANSPKVLTTAGAVAVVAAGTLTAYMLSKKSNRRKVTAALKSLPEKKEKFLKAAKTKAGKVKETLYRVEQVLEGAEKTAETVQSLTKKATAKRHHAHA